MAEPPPNRRSFRIWLFIDAAILAITSVAWGTISAPNPAAGQPALSPQVQSPSGQHTPPQQFDPAQPHLNKTVDGVVGPFAGDSALNANPKGAAQIGFYHRRSQEVTSLMGAYIFRMVEELKEEIAKPLDENHDDDLIARKLRNEKIGRLLKSFCIKGEKKVACAERYIRLQRPVLNRIRKSLVQSADHEAELACTKFNQQRECIENEKAPSMVSSEDAPDLQIQLPLLPTYAELQAYVRSAQLTNQKMPSRDDYERWVNQVALEPDRTDFVKYKEIPRDPENPEAGHFTVIEKNEKGEVVIDEKAYAAAKKAWESDKEALLMDQAMMKADQVDDQRLEKVRENFLKETPVHDQRRDYERSFLYGQTRGPLVGGAKKVMDTPKTPANRETKKDRVARDVKGAEAKKATIIEVERPPEGFYKGDEKLVAPASQAHGGSGTSGSGRTDHNYSVQYDIDTFSPDNIEKLLDVP